MIDASALATPRHQQPDFTEQPTDRGAPADLGRDLLEAGIVPKLLQDRRGRLLPVPATDAAPNFALRRAIESVRGHAGVQASAEPFYRVECPISGEACIFPAQLADGHTYEKATVEKMVAYYESPFRTTMPSPMSRMPLPYPPTVTCDTKVLDLALYDYRLEHGSFAELPMHADNKTPALPFPKNRWLPALAAAASVGGAMMALAGRSAATIGARLPRVAIPTCPQEACGVLSQVVYTPVQAYNDATGKNDTWFTAMVGQVGDPATIDACHAAAASCWEHALAALDQSHRFDARMETYVDNAAMALRLLGAGIVGWKLLTVAQRYRQWVRARDPKALDAERRASQARVEAALAEDLAALQDKQTVRSASRASDPAPAAAGPASEDCHPDDVTPVHLSVGAQKRLLKDWRALQRTEETSNVWAAPIKDNLSHWEARIKCVDGPLAKSAEAAGVEHITLRIDFPENYPVAPPQVLIVSPQLQHRFNYGGALCADILTSHGWVPTYTVEKLLVQLAEMLHNPECEPSVTGTGSYNLDSAARMFKHGIERPNLWTWKH